MRFRPVLTMLFLCGLAVSLSACYYAPAPGYAYDDSGYYYGAPAYYGPAYYGPSVGVYYGGGWHHGWDHR